MVFTFTCWIWYCIWFCWCGELCSVWCWLLTCCCCGELCCGGVTCPEYWVVDNFKSLLCFWIDISIFVGNEFVFHYLNRVILYIDEQNFLILINLNANYIYQYMLWHFTGFNFIVILLLFQVIIFSHCFRFTIIIENFEYFFKRKINY